MLVEMHVGGTPPGGGGATAEGRSDRGICGQPDMPTLKVGDSVAVDLTGMYFGYCHGCDEVILVIPGGGCLCGASELRIEWLRLVTTDDITYPEAT